jgi:hypothetical protein
LHATGGDRRRQRRKIGAICDESDLAPSMLCVDVGCEERSASSTQR